KLTPLTNNELLYSVMGQEGATVTIVCSYNELSKSNVKYWCKRGSETCNTLVRSDDHDRISITDDQTQRAFTVTMTGLREDDKGQYYCAIETGEDSAEYFGVLTKELNLLLNFTFLTFS
uniref:Ig-like domain-containing protein n=1 Tax=Erpetoichthys calabaricus TaxID=27687 RepID=A0A8C4X5D5_ERPCA